MSDVETLRKIATLLDRENQTLHDRVRDLTEKIARLQGEDAASVQQELEWLRELLARRERALFSESSERRSHPIETPGDRTPQRGHGPKAQPELPVVEQVHELPEGQRRCTACGGELSEMKSQAEESEEITVLERQFTLVRHLRKKYRCSCNGFIATAPGPVKLQAGSRYSPEFAVEVAVGKYLDHLPLERQCRMMRREGLQVDSQTLWDQIETLARVLRPTYHALQERVLASPLVGADETHWRLMDKKGSKRWWAWSVSGKDALFHKILDSRSQQAASQVLGDYRGIVMADGYGAYDALSRDGPGFTLAHCWAHVRRKFIEVESQAPEICQAILDLIGKLYEVERSVPSTDAQEALRLRAQLRHEHSRPTIRDIQAWALSQRVLPESGVGKAIAYMLGMWKGLTLFLEDPRIPLDNNQTERGLRGLVVGRKNHYGSRSRRGTQVAALFYSLLESAKLCGVEPKAYLLTATRSALASPGTVTLPHSLLS
ncbi:MAG: IS66 family transposase [Acidobacteria bacterium]|nr:IS66 family transposase [Acidobacteriota bacterium]